MSLPVRDTIFLVATWAALAFLLDFLSMQISRSGVSDSTSGLLNLLRRMPSERAQHLVLVAILLTAGYLAFTSLTAIHSLPKNGVREGMTPADLQGSLTKIRLSEEQFNRRFPEDLHLTTLEVSQIQASTDPPPNPMIAMLAQLRVEEREQGLGNLVKAWWALRLYYLGRQDQQMETAIRHYEVSNLNRYGEREKAQHFLDLYTWYQDWLAAAEQHLGRCQTALISYSAALREQDILLIGLMQASGTGENVPFMREDLNRSQRPRDVAELQCRSGHSELKIPTRADYGAYLGPIGAMTRWLLKTESLALALLTGLVGFGMIGAAVSTIMQKKIQATPGQVSPSDNLSIVIRGASAAAVVFLGVYAGLAAFAGTEAKPAPHMVLFTCFVGAVFSDVVWNWARARLRSLLPDQRGESPMAKK